MPGFNRRGPMGQGPMTGRRMGRCTNYGSIMERGTDTIRDSHPEDKPENFHGVLVLEEDMEAEAGGGKTGSGEPSENYKVWSE